MHVFTVVESVDNVVANFLFLSGVLLDELISQIAMFKV